MLEKHRRTTLAVLLPLFTVHNNENFQEFFNLIDLLKKDYKIDINLYDKSFSYSIIIIYNISPNDINFANAAKIFLPILLLTNTSLIKSIRL